MARTWALKEDSVNTTIIHWYSTVSTSKLLEEAAWERMQLTKKLHDEVERAQMVLDKVQTTYQSKVLEYEVRAQATTALIKKLVDEKQAT